MHYFPIQRLLRGTKPVLMNFQIIVMLHDIIYVHKKEF